MGPTLRAVEGHIPVLEAAGRARRALFGLQRAIDDGDVPLVPDQRAAVDVIVFAEARASCAIEDLVDAQQVMAPPPGRAPEDGLAHVLACRRAIVQGWRSLEALPVCRRVAQEMCATLTCRPAGLRQNLGTALRRGGAAGQVIYTPPVGEGHISDLLGDWEATMNDTLHDPLVQMAAGHAHFELIHPFLDGNGRTGRAINLLHLVAQGLLSAPLLCMSDLLLRRRDTYYRLLLAVTERSAWVAWICFMLEIVEESAAWTRHLLRERGR